MRWHRSSRPGKEVIQLIRLVISNQRGGVAKTTTAVILARSFAGKGKRVLLIDTDSQGSIRTILGLKPEFHLADFLIRNMAFRECVVHACENVDVVCSNRDTTEAEVTLSNSPFRELTFERLFSEHEAAYDVILIGVAADRSQFFKDLTAPFFGANRPGAKVSQGVRDAFWFRGMQGGLKNQLDCIKAFSETDFTEDLKKFNMPTLIIHGDDDQIVPIGASAHASSKLVKHPTLKIYPGASHGIADTHKDQLNADLLAFLKT